MSKVFGQIVIDVELDEESVNGALLDLSGLGVVLRDHLETLPMNGSQMRILTVYSPTKDWQIGAQLALGQPFNGPVEPAEEQSGQPAGEQP